MTDLIRNRLDENQELQQLLRSREWAGDNVGILFRRYMDVACSVEGVTEEDALEYLHEEDVKDSASGPEDDLHRSPLGAINAILANDEASTDEELVQHFQTFGLSEKEARKHVARRSSMLGGRL
jgi:hypothetical protein